MWMWIDVHASWVKMIYLIKEPQNKVLLGEGSRLAQRITERFKRRWHFDNALEKMN